MPLDSTTVIPAAWSQHHQGAAAGGMNATVTVGTGGESTYDPDTDETTVSWSQEYAGPARIQALTQATEQESAGQQIAGRPYLVQLDARLPGADQVRAGMRVRCTAAVNDAALVGQDLWVVDFQMGSERFTRDLVCSDNQADTPQEP
jgi:hypothetical protein